MGGYVYKSGGDCTVDGTTYATACWQQVVTTDSIPSGDVTLANADGGNVGAGEVAACASNTNVMYLIWVKRVYVSTNKGATWIYTNQTTNQQVNGGPLQANWIACDPANPDIAYLVTPAAGTFKTINGTSGASASWSAVSGIANANGNGGNVVYDPNSSVVGGVTQRLMISSAGTGVYESTNGSTFTLRSSGTPPTKVIQMNCDKFGQFWATESFQGSGGQVYKFASSTWTQINIAGEPNQIVSVLFDPNTGGSVAANRVIGVDGSGFIVVSLDNGATWTGISSISKSAIAPQPTWLNGTFQGSPLNMNAVMASIDTAGNVWIATGIDVFKTTNPIVAGSPVGSIVWSADTIGIDQLVVNQIIAPPGNSPIVTVWDRGLLLVKNPDVFPSSNYPNSGSVNIIQGGWGIDYAAPTPNFIVATIASNLDTSSAPSSSSDGGNTWSLWASSPANFSSGSMIAVSSTTNWATVPGDSTTGTPGGKIYFTTNGATSWTQSTVPGTPTFVNTNNGHQDNRQALAADRVTAGKFYAVDTAFNFYRSTNSGSSFSLIAANPFDGSSGRDQLQSVPGQADNLFFIPNLAPGGHIWKSTDAGSTWAKVPSSGALDRIAGFGFGAPLPGGGYPSIYAYANLSGVNGLYQSNDGGATWAYINVPTSEKTWPYRTLDGPTWVIGDMNVYGRVYLGYLGSGATYIDTQDACPWVNFSNVNPNAALTGTVTLSAVHSGLVPVTGVQFSVDGANIGSSQTGQSTYSVSWNASGVAPGAHTLKVQATGNGCTINSNSFSIPITTSANDNDLLSKVA